MKYLMGLILTVGLGTATFAQDNGRETQDDTNKDAYTRNLKEADSDDDASVRNEDSDNPNCVRFENGSVEYYENPETSVEMQEEEGYQPQSRESESMELENSEMDQAEAQPEADPRTLEDATRSSDDGSLDQSNMETSDAEVEITSEDIDVDLSSEGEVSSEQKLDLSQCALNRELTSREGSFKEKREQNGGKLKVEREKDGDESLKFETDTEYYKYEKDSDGEEGFLYSKSDETSAVQVMKYQDGTAEVIYQQYFNSIEEANQALEDGLRLESTSSACTGN